MPEATSSKYTGGHVFMHDPEGEFDHLYVAFEGTGIHDEDIYAAQMIDPASGLQRQRAPRAHCWAYIQGNCPRRGTCRYYHPQKRELCESDCR